MLSKHGLKILIALLILVFGISYQAKAQVSAGGIISRASSQLIFWYDEDDTTTDRNSYLQLTNTSPTNAVEVHIQIYASTGDGSDINNTVRCVDNDFNDVLTANDTHVYDLEDIRLNTGELGTPAPITSVDDTKGFVVVTPVVGSGDNTAISFQYLIGTTTIEDTDVIDDVYVVSAAGRDAVDLTNGSILAQGTALNGTSTGYLLIQPDEVVFNFAESNGVDMADIASITFADEYGPAGLLGYRAVPGDAVFTPFLFDFQEIPASCPEVVNACFNNWGLSAQFPAINNLIDPGINICDAVVLPDDVGNGEVVAWSRIFVSGLSEVENHLTILAISDIPSAEGGADWSNVVGPPIPIVPPDECTNLPAECGNPVCKPLPGCENPDGVDPDGVNFCQDGVDNDGVNGTDCQDFGCDGFVAITSEEGDPTGPCESAGETSCADEFDNDANGFVDCGLLGGEPDPNCVAIGACGDDDDDDDDGGNCSLAGPVATGTAAANFLLPLLPLAGAYALRRIRRRNNK